MAETKLIRDHHLLTRNLKLNGKYLSNDGDDEGISIGDTGLVTVSGDLDIASNMTIADNEIDIKSGDFLLDVTGDITLDAAGQNIYLKGGIYTVFDFNIADNSMKIMSILDDDDYCKIHVGNNGITTISTVDNTVLTNAHLTLDPDGDIILDANTGITKFYDAGDDAEFASITVVGGTGGTTFATASAAADGHLTLAPDGDTIIDRNTAITATGTAKGLHIDYDHTGISASGQTVSGIGLDLDMNCESVIHVGTVNQTGIDIDMVAATDGTQTNTGINIAVSGADTNYALITSGGNVGIGESAPTASVHINTDITDTSDGTYTALSIDFDRTGESTGTNTMNGILIDMDNLEAHGGTNTMYGIYCTPRMVDIADPGGTATIVGSYFAAVGSSNGTTTSVGVRIDESVVTDTHYGLQIRSSSQTADFFAISTGVDAETTISTVEDGGGSTAHLNIEADGHVEFDGCAVGFDVVIAPFGDSAVIGGGGYDTDIDFRTGNKIVCSLTADIVNLNLIFPDTTGNFVLLLKYDGDHDITNWKVYESDESAADGDTDVLWPGGTAPATTDSGVDIFSFFYDATSGSDRCYGVGSLDFSN